MTLSALGEVRGKVPPASQMPCSRAAPAMKSWMGPLPGASAWATLSVSWRPMMGQYSGRLTRVAPAADASATRRRAVAMLLATSGVEIIWMAATWLMVLRSWVKCLLRCGLDGRSLRHFRDHRRLPRALDLHFIGQRFHHGRAQEQLGQETAQADHGVDGQGIHQWPRAQIELRYHHHPQIGRFVGDVGAAVHQDGGG